MSIEIKMFPPFAVLTSKVELHLRTVHAKFMWKSATREVSGLQEDRDTETDLRMSEIQLPELESSLGIQHVLKSDAITGHFKKK